MKRRWTNLFAAAAKSRVTKRQNSRLAGDPLEERVVMDGMQLGLSDVVAQEAVSTQVNWDRVQLNDGVLTILGGMFNDEVEVQNQVDSITVTINGETSSFERFMTLTYYPSDPYMVLVGSPIETRHSLIDSIEFYGGTGDDRFVNKSDLPALAYGEQGNDFLIGGWGNDRLEGGDGDDSILGSIGDDVLIGGRGVDRIQGENGNDRIYGGADNDQLFGGLDSDTIQGGDGNDALFGGDGVDNLYGDAGHDDLDGGEGFDNLIGGSGIDWFAPSTDNVWIDDPETNGFVPYDGSTLMVSIDDHLSLHNLVPHNAGLSGVTSFLNLNQQWASNVDAVRDKMLEKLGAIRYGGQNLYDISLSLPDQGTQEIAQDEWGTHLRLNLPGASLVATSTQPTSLGSWADPTFRVSFDLTLNIQLAPTGGLKIVSFDTTVSNAQISAKGIVAEVVTFFNTMLDVFVGVDLMAIAEDAINSTKIPSVVPSEGLNLVNALAPDASVVYDPSQGIVLLRTARHSAPINITPPSWTPFEEYATAGNEYRYVGQGDADGLTADELTDQYGAALLRADDGESVFTDPRFSESTTSVIPSEELVAWGAEYFVSDIDWALLNPQPLPPQDVQLDSVLEVYEQWGSVAAEPTLGELTAYDLDAVSDLDWALLNPQPLPPRDFLADEFDIASDLDWAPLNPQPLPPRESHDDDFAVTSIDLGLDELGSIATPSSLVYSASGLDWAMLNPQPLPPRELQTSAISAYTVDRLFARTYRLW